MNQEGQYSLASWEITLSRIVRAAQSEPGKFFETLTRTLSESLGVGLCFATELIEAPALRARTLAFWNRGEYLDSFEYDLEGTPCEQVAAGGTVCHGERIRELFPRDPDLETLGVESYVAVPMIDPDGQVVGHLAVLDEHPLEPQQIDLTLLRLVAQVAVSEFLRRRAIDRLEQREKLLRQVIDLTPHLVFAKDSTGRFLLGNQALADRFGISVEHLIGKRDEDFINVEEAERFRRDDERVMRSGRRLDVLEETFTDADGSRRSLSTSKIPFDVAGTGEPAVLGISVDVTAQVQAERRLRSLVEATAPATGREFFSILVAQLAEMLDVRSAVLGEVMDDHIHGLALWADKDHGQPLDYALSETPCAEVFATGAQFQVAHSAGKRYSDVTWLSSLGAEHYLGTPLLGTDSEVIGVLAVMHDAPKSVPAQDRRLLELFAARASAELRRQRAESRQRELQAQVLHVQKLESLGVLAGGIAHDFNNLLATILGNAGLALMQAPEDEELRRCLQEIELAAERSGELTRQMLNYSGKGRTVVEALDLREVIAEMGELLRSSVSKKAHLSLEINSLLPSIDGDPVQIRQLVLNLITNAAEALGGGSGQVTVHAFESAPPVEPDPLGGTIHGPCVCLEVQDDGCGMDEETLERLFDPFYSTKRTGRGLGMATVQGVARRHRAVIKVSSTLGSGTGIRIYFPCSTMEAESGERWSFTAASDSRGSGTVLVVDDEEAVRRTAASILKHRGFDVLEAADGFEALDLFRLHEEIDLVLLDLTMPGLDGLETMERMREIRSVRVILTTGFSEHDVSAADVDGFLEKPYRPDMLVEAIGEVMPGTLSPAPRG